MLTVIEVAGRSAEYQWDHVDTSKFFPKITIFPSLMSNQVPLRALNSELCTALEKLEPNVVAIPGWANRAGLIALQYCLRKSIPVVIMSDSNEIDAKRFWLKEFVKKRIV
ncbi:MAG: hypothetical protein WBG18_01695, partial [Xanthobacteraceae bacterium]